MKNITLAVFVIVNVLAAVGLHVLGVDRLNPSSDEMVKMFLASLVVSTVLFVVIAKITGRKLFQGFR